MRGDSPGSLGKWLPLVPTWRAPAGPLQGVGLRMDVEGAGDCRVSSIHIPGKVSCKQHSIPMPRVDLHRCLSLGPTLSAPLPTPPEAERGPRAAELEAQPGEVTGSRCYRGGWAHPCFISAHPLSPQEGPASVGGITWEGTSKSRGVLLDLPCSCGPAKGRAGGGLILVVLGGISVHSISS